MADQDERRHTGCVRAQVERAYRRGFTELDVHQNGGACCHVCAHKPLFRDLSMLYLHANGNLPSSPDRAAKSSTSPEYPRCKLHSALFHPTRFLGQRAATPRGALGSCSRLGLVSVNRRPYITSHTAALPHSPAPQIQAALTTPRRARLTKAPKMLLAGPCRSTWGWCGICTGCCATRS